MNGYRVSYLKTALAALTVCMALLAFTGHELVAAAPLVANAGLRWIVVVAASAAAVACSLVAMGGFFALHEDAHGAAEHAARRAS